jgi:hypothetical protein
MIKKFDKKGHKEIKKLLDKLGKEGDPPWARRLAYPW